MLQTISTISEDSKIKKATSVSLAGLEEGDNVLRLLNRLEFKEGRPWAKFLAGGRGRLPVGALGGGRGVAAQVVAAAGGAREVAWTRIRLCEIQSVPSYM
jgi:hypothetical protein